MAYSAGIQTGAAIISYVKSEGPVLDGPPRNTDCGRPPIYELYPGYVEFDKPSNFAPASFTRISCVQECPRYFKFRSRRAGYISIILPPAGRLWGINSGTEPEMGRTGRNR